MNKPRFFRTLRVLQTVIDLAVLSAALWGAFFLRFEGHLPYQMLKRALLLWPYLTALQYTALAVMGVPRFSWRYVGLREALRILAASAAVAVVLVISRLIAGTMLETKGLSLIHI